MSTKSSKTPAKSAKKTAEQQEAKRQSTEIPVTVGDMETDGSHAIDHMTVLDSHEEPDTNKEPVEDIDERNRSDLSFWNNSWTWTKAATSYGNKPEDSWFINPTPKLVAEVMSNAPTIHSACEVALIAGEHKAQLQQERDRHNDFLRSALESDLISEALDLLTAYQGRFFESVQRYIGQNASYQNQLNNPNANQEQLEAAEMRKHNSGAQCRAWAARLIALIEAYQATVSDNRAYRLTYDFSPLPPEGERPPTREYSLYKWSVTNTLNRVGRRLARSIKDGKMDAEQYRIPRPWLTDTQRGAHLEANDMLSDFN